MDGASMRSPLAGLRLHALHEPFAALDCDTGADFAAAITWRDSRYPARLFLHRYADVALALEHRERRDVARPSEREPEARVGDPDVPQLDVTEPRG